MVTSSTISDKTSVKLNILKYKVKATSHNQLIESLINLVYRLRLFEELKQEITKEDKS